MRRLLATLALSLVTAVPAAAQSGCAQRAGLVSHLTSAFGETLNSGGLRDAGSVYEVWVSEVTGTWTILKTNADGTACIVASGTHWRIAAPVAEPAGTQG